MGLASVMSPQWSILVLAALMAASFFFSAAEAALFSLSRGQLHKLRGSTPAGKIVADLMARPRHVLNTLLLSNTVVTTAYSAIAAVAVLHMQEADRLPDWAAVPMSLVPLVALIMLAEVLPKSLAFIGGPKWALVAAPPVAALARVFWPVLRLLDSAIITPVTRLLAPSPSSRSDITPAELGMLLDLSAKRGVIDHEASSLLQEIVEMSDLRVRDIMVPRVDVIAYDVAGDAAGLLELFRSTRLRRVPVYEGNIDRVIGLVHAKKLLLAGAGADLRTLVSPAPFVPQTAKVERLLVLLRVTRAQMAIVVDEYGGAAGIVTMKDVLEEIVGAIPDPFDEGRPPAVVRVGPREYLVDGDLAFHEWADIFDINLAGRRLSTVGGLVTSLLGRIAKVGDTVSRRNLKFTVESMRRRRIGQLRLRLLEGGEQ